ncbi:chitobiase/beta-hexosaminidase C-terminal domain-containing protein [Algibacter sp. L4_22]|uniref:chitobiase/beta-hexosaminidase C-terminal domain-containing protein n=1 Tax=Algibacter sp. L4_22 TaxID=2942477 RepID=UPI00201B8F71|nr:chitobiase/beta-hexosaminidase C-terminal domain-containing protein [Algibacter sp. L4_22]MCL5129576.1 chitobiase/beta-hexosaminidase C-terminal domain-containing protein [Algibacter sp. L4_22]
MRFFQIFLIFVITISFTLKSYAIHEIYVSTEGSDQNSGIKSAPFATFGRAVKALEKFSGKEAVTVWFTEGTYYLNETILLNSKLSGTAENPIVFSSLPGNEVFIKGSKLLKSLPWKTYKSGVYVTEVPEHLNFDQLFVNGNRKIRARYPNYDYENPLRGGKGYLQVSDGSNRRYDTWFGLKDKDIPTRDWENPSTGIVHAFQSHNWGNMQYRIKSIDKTEKKVFLGEGGWQLQRAYGIGGKGNKGSWFFIDNIFEELDVAGEWFLDLEKHLLYYFPEEGVDLNTVTFEVPILKDLIQLKGSADKPVKHISISGFNFTQSKTTFMDTYEPVARGDWAIHRGGAIFMEGAENCSITDNNFEYLGGNGVFMSAYNRNNTVSSCRFVHVGESAVAFVGSPDAVRFYQTWDDREIDGENWDDMRKNMDLEPGPKSPNYPKNCTIENSVMHDFGDYGKQVAGIYISMSHKIKASHNTIYNCPRAGICINDGTWGGHIIEFNDIWETVRETGEHGPFNSWGRERQWRGSRGTDEQFLKELTKLDAIDNVIIRNNRIANYRKSISAGNWTIDLDDGSSYFEIYNNLNLGSTIKLRDGMERKVFNNITVSAVPLGWHVWPKNSEDEIYKNIFVISGALPGKNEPTKKFIRDVGLPTETKWSEHYDNNMYWNINHPNDFDIIDGVGLKSWQEKGYDINAVSGNPLFVNPSEGNYQVQENSEALKLGFKNFPMDQFGHQMTRIIPFGGEFSETQIVQLVVDNRVEKNAKIYYTLDGTEPTINSIEYSKPIQLKKSRIIKAQTFDSNGVAVGFVNETTFAKVEKVIYPSWLSTLLAGKYEGEVENLKKALILEVKGAVMINIADDPDLIDATGGYNFGCYIQSLNPEKSQMWTKAKLDRDWVIQQVNGNKVQNISDLNNYLKKFKGKKVTVIAVRDYKEKKFKVEF